MKRVIINLIETQNEIQHLMEIMKVVPEFEEVCNLFNEKYYLKTISNKNSFGNGLSGIFLIEVKDNTLYIDNENFSEVFRQLGLLNAYHLTELIPRKYKKYFMAITSLIYHLLNEKNIRTTDKVYKIRLNNHKIKKVNSNKVILKNYKYEKKENQGHIYNRSDKQWKVRGHYRNVRGTLYWVNSYDKQFII